MCKDKLGMRRIDHFGSERQIQGLPGTFEYSVSQYRRRKGLASWPIQGGTYGDDAAANRRCGILINACSNKAKRSDKVQALHCKVCR